LTESRISVSIEMMAIFTRRAVAHASIAALLVLLLDARTAPAQIPTFTRIETFTPIRSFTPILTFTPVLTFTPIKSFTPIPTSTFPGVPTGTVTTTPTITVTPKTTPTASPGVSGTATITATRVPTRTPTPLIPATDAPTPLECVGDCDDDGRVSVTELTLGVLISTGQRLIAFCAPLDTDGNNAVTINELIRAVASALDGCR
jgi:hypothetical protein